MAAREAKRALTPEAFGRFLRWLSADDDFAVREYQSMRTKLVRYFMHKGCPDPDELFDQTVDIVAGKIEICGQCPSPLAYCYGVAKNVWRQQTREPKPAVLIEDIPARQDLSGDRHEQELKCLESCMEKLSPGDREVVARYYQGQGREKIETRLQLADRLGGVNALRIRACRIRKELRGCVVACIGRSVN
jgi:DNA-directed RNA polymerase specialized sigma24 family protein